MKNRKHPARKDSEQALRRRRNERKKRAAGQALKKTRPVLDDSVRAAVTFNIIGHTLVPLTR